MSHLGIAPTTRLPLDPKMSTKTSADVKIGKTFAQCTEGPYRGYIAWVPYCRGPYKTHKPESFLPIWHQTLIHFKPLHNKIPVSKAQLHKDNQELISCANDLFGQYAALYNEKRVHDSDVLVPATLFWNWSIAHDMNMYLNKHHRLPSISKQQMDKYCMDNCIVLAHMIAAYDKSGKKPISAAMVKSLNQILSEYDTSVAAIKHSMKDDESYKIYGHHIHTHDAATIKEHLSTWEGSLVDEFYLHTMRNYFWNFTEEMFSIMVRSYQCFEDALMQVHDPEHRAYSLYCMYSSMMLVHQAKSVLRGL